MLETNNLGNEGIRMLSLFAFPHLPSLQRLWLQETGFDNGGILSLAAGLPLLRNLELLDVSHNNITVAGLTAGSPSFLATLAALPAIRELDIDSIAFPILHAHFPELLLRRERFEPPLHYLPDELSDSFYVFNP